MYIPSEKILDFEIPRAWPVNIYHTNGYPIVHHHVNGEQKTFPLHRLTAVAEYGIEAVKNKHVHHINKHPIDCRRENLIPLEKDVHKAVDTVANVFLSHPEAADEIVDLAADVTQD